MATTQYQIFCRYFNGTLNRTVTNQTPCRWVSKEEWNNLMLFCSDAANKSLYAKLCDQLAGRVTAANPKIPDPNDPNKQIVNLRWQKDFSIQENECYTLFKTKEEIEALEKKNLVVREVCLIEPHDYLYNDTNGTKRRKKMMRDLAHWDTITTETSVNNPKYDMLFMYNGLAKQNGPICGVDDPDISGIQEYKQDYGATPSGSENYALNPPSGTTNREQQPYIYYDGMKRVTFDIWFEHSVHASLASAMAKANELVNIMGKQNVKIGKVVPLDKYIEIV